MFEKLAVFWMRMISEHAQKRFGVSDISGIIAEALK